MPRWFSPAKQKVLKAVLQGSVLLPYHAASETTSSSARAAAFRFATAYSAKPQLSTAVVECVSSVTSQLGPGRHPHFCQLLVTSDPYGSNIEYAPSVSRSNLVLLLHALPAKHHAMQCSGKCSAHGYAVRARVP